MSKRPQALKAQYERDVAIKTAGFMAETEQAKAQAAQAGPLAAAKASQDVITEQTKLAERQAELAAQRLEADVRRPADAEAYRQRTLAEAQRDQAKFAADGAAYAERTTAEAQAEANKARAESLRQGNQELIAANRIIEELPALVQAAARGLAGSNLTILNGTEGVSEVLVGLVGQGMSILDALKKATGAPANGNGAALVPTSSRPAGPTP